MPSQFGMEHDWRVPYSETGAQGYGQKLTHFVSLPTSLEALELYEATARETRPIYNKEGQPDPAENNCDKENHVIRNSWEEMHQAGNLFEYEDTVVAETESKADETLINVDQNDFGNTGLKKEPMVSEVVLEQPEKYDAKGLYLTSTALLKPSVIKKQSKKNKKQKIAEFEMQYYIETFQGLREKYRLLSKIGEGTVVTSSCNGVGTFSSVFKASQGNEQEEEGDVAVKVIYCISSPERIGNEVKILNILRYFC